MTVKKFIKQLKKQAKKRGILNEEIQPLYSGGSSLLLMTTDENGTRSFWKVGYDVIDGEITSVIKS